MTSHEPVLLLESAFVACFGASSIATLMLRLRYMNVLVLPLMVVAVGWRCGGGWFLYHLVIFLRWNHLNNSPGVKGNEGCRLIKPPGDSLPRFYATIKSTQTEMVILVWLISISSGEVHWFIFEWCGGCCGQCEFVLFFFIVLFILITDYLSIVGIVNADGSEIN